MTITWDSTYERFKAAQRAHIRASPKVALRFAFYLILLPVAALIGMVMLSLDILAGKNIGETGFVIPFALLGASIGGWGSRILTLRKSYKNSWPSKTVERRNTLVISEKGICAEFPGVGKTQLEWNAFCRFVESKWIILVYLSETRWLNIPRDVLTEDQHVELVQLLETHIPGGRC
jgi:hypothetical protein